MVVGPTTPTRTGARGRVWGLGLVLVALSLAGVVLDAHRRRAAVDFSSARAYVEATGHGELFLSSGSRWLRHPRLSEPGAASADAPDGLDVDPAGMAIAGYDGARGGAWLVVLPRSE